MFKDVDVQEIEKKKKDQELEIQRRPTNMKVKLRFYTGTFWPIQSRSSRRGVQKQNCWFSDQRRV